MLAPPAPVAPPDVRLRPEPRPSAGSHRARARVAGSGAGSRRGSSPQGEVSRMLGSSHRRRHSAEHLSVNPLFAQGSVLAPIPSRRLPAGEMSSTAAYQIIHDRVPAQEHDQQGRVPANRGDRAPLRLDARGPVECARPVRGARLLDGRLERGLHARGPRPAAPLREPPVAPDKRCCRTPIPAAGSPAPACATRGARTGRL